MKTTPPPLAELIRGATQGTWHPPIWQKPGHPRNHSYVLCEGYCGAICNVYAKVPGTLPSEDDNPPLKEAICNGQLIARVASPEAAAKVLEALESCKVVPIDDVSFRLEFDPIKVRAALQRLNGLNPPKA